MEDHNKKREKIFDKKLNHFKLLDDNWKHKIKQIKLKKKQ
jgi:hypothetical protein